MPLMYGCATSSILIGKHLIVNVGGDAGQAASDCKRSREVCSTVKKRMDFETSTLMRVDGQCAVFAASKKTVNAVNPLWEGE
jgi:hypothetical protein